MGKGRWRVEGVLVGQVGDGQKGWKRVWLWMGLRRSSIRFRARFITN